MNEKNTLSKSAMYFGAILGIALVFFMFITYILDVTAAKAIGYLQYAIIVAGLFISQKKYRDDNLKGYISYGKALGFGTLTVFFASLIVGFFTYLLYSIIDPGLMEKILTASEDAMFERGLSDDEIDMAMQITRKFTNPLVLTFSTVFGITFIGFLFSLITSIFVKKKNDSFESNFE